MSHTVMATPVAERQIRGLRGPRRRAYEQFEQTLAATGCAALGYRLTGEDPLPQLCVKHLRGADRVVVAFVTRTAWVLLVGPHAEGDQAADVYTTLYELAGIARPASPARNSPAPNRPAAAQPMPAPHSWTRPSSTSSSNAPARYVGRRSPRLPWEGGVVPGPALAVARRRPS